MKSPRIRQGLEDKTISDRKSGNSEKKFESLDEGGRYITATISGYGHLREMTMDSKEIYGFKLKIEGFKDFKQIKATPPPRLFVGRG